MKKTKKKEKTSIGLTFSRKEGKFPNISKKLSIHARKNIIMRQLLRHTKGKYKLWIHYYVNKLPFDQLRHYWKQYGVISLFKWCTNMKTGKFNKSTYFRMFKKVSN